MKAGWLALLVLGFGCQTKTEKKGESMDISTEIQRLRTHIQVPAELSEVRWLAAPRGAPGIGPTDLVLLARFPLSPMQWAALKPSLTPVKQANLAVPAPVKALVGRDRLVGDVFTADPFLNIRWRDGQSVWDGTALTVVLFSG